MTEELAIVIGTANTMIYMPNNGIVLCEPSIVAYTGDPKSGKVRYVGNEAAATVGKTPENTNLRFPVTDGIISSPDACRDMLAAFLKKLIRPGLFGPKIRAIAAIPTGLALEERRIYDDVFARAGISDVIMIEKVLLAAVGAELPVHSDKVSLIANIGAGTTSIAAVASSGIVYGCSANIGGIMMDKALRDYILGKYNFRIGLSEAERIKCGVGSLFSNDKRKMTSRGADLTVMSPSSFDIKSTDVMEAVMPYYLRVADAIESIIRSLRPEIAADIYTDGLHLTGGACLIPGIEKMFSERLRIPVSVHVDSEYAAVLGAGKLLTNKAALREILSQN